MANESIKALAVEIALEDGSFRDGVNNLKRNMAVIDTQFKSSVAGLKNWGKSLDGLKAHADTLGKKINAQKDIVKAYEAELQKVQGALQKNSEKMMDLKGKLDATRAAYEQSKAATGANSAETTKLKDELTKLGKEYANSERLVLRNEKSVQGYTIQINKTTGEINKLESELKRTNETIKNFNWDKFSTGLESVSKKMASLGRNMSLYVTAPITAAFGYMFKSASDLNENIQKTNEVFDYNANSVLEWAETAVEQFGLAKSTALDMASGFGDMATSMGFSTAQAADMSTSLVGLAADMASFKNINIDVAKTALTAVFTGETESLKKLGIVMTEANLKEFALSQGIKKRYSEMSQAEKVQLRYNYLFSMTANAHGDFERTAGGAANQMRILQESIKELATNFGEHILPTITHFIKRLNELIKQFGALDDGTQKLILGAAALLAVLGPTMTLMGNLGKAVVFLGSACIKFGLAAKAAAAAQWLWNAAMAGNPIGAVVVALIALVGTMAWAYFNIKKEIKELEEEATQSIKEMGEKEREEISKTAKARMEAIDERERLATEYFNNENKRLNKQYQEALKAENKRIAALKKQLQQEQKLLDDNYNAAIQAIRDEYGVFEKTQKSKTEVLQEAYNRVAQYANDFKSLAQSVAQSEGDAYEKAAQAMLESARETHNAKMIMITQEYLAQMRLINDTLAAELNGYQSRITAINDTIQAEERAEKQKNDAQKLLDLQENIKNAKTLQERKKAQKAYNDEVVRQNKERLALQRQNEIASLEQKKQEAIRKANEEKDALLPVYQERLNQEQVAFKEHTDKNIEEIQRERIAAEQAENAKYEAAKKALEDKAEYYDNWIEDVYQPMLDKQLEKDTDYLNKRLNKFRETLKTEREETAKWEKEEIEKQQEQQKKDEALAEYRALIKQWEKNEYEITGAAERNWLTNAIFFLEHPILSTKQLMLIAEIDKKKKELKKLNVPGFASGVINFRGGLARVNEKGGEILNLPRGTNVIPHDVSMRIAQSLRGIHGGNSITIINKGTIVGSNGMQEFARIVSQQIGGEYALTVGGS